jgi:formiminotetrahydrofolate cyclodeaminase
MTRTIKKKGKDVRKDATVVLMAGGLMKMVKTVIMFKRRRWNQLDQRLAKVIAKREKVKREKTRKEM